MYVGVVIGQKKIESKIKLKFYKFEFVIYRTTKGDQ